jgi:hypothetical protein
MTLQQLTTNKIKLALINSGLINQDGWISTGTESSDFSDEFEQAVNKLNDIISNSLDQNNKEWLKRVEGLRIKKLKPYFSFNDSWNECVDKLNTSIDNLVNKYKQL